MAQFILDQSALDTEALGPITYATASASLGSLTATALDVVTNTVSATANLGAMVASATVPNRGSNSGGPAYIHPNVYVPEVIKEPIKVIQTINGVAYTNLLSMKANATSRIDFSIMEDDSEVLLLI